MNYTIGELSKIMNVSIHTLRYYDNEGLLPFVQRKPNGQRIFTHRDLIFLNTIECLKSTGMPLKEIKQYIEWCIEGMPTVPQRYELFLDQSYRRRTNSTNAENTCNNKLQMRFL